MYSLIAVIQPVTSYIVFDRDTMSIKAADYYEIVSMSQSGQLDNVRLENTVVKLLDSNHKGEDLKIDEQDKDRDIIYYAYKHEDITENKPIRLWYLVSNAGNIIVMSEEVLAADFDRYKVFNLHITRGRLVLNRRKAHNTALHRHYGTGHR